jgi:cell division protein FtsI/penicillin-binding protein 2
MSYKKRRKIERLNRFQEPKKEAAYFKLLKFLQKFLIFLSKLLFLPFLPLVFLSKKIFKDFSSDFFIKFGFGLLFVSILFQLAQLQVSGFSNFVNTNFLLERFSVEASTSNQSLNRRILQARRGQIFIRDDSQGNNAISVTSTEIQSLLFFDPSVLLSQVKKGLDLDAAAQEIASVLNISKSLILSKLESEIKKDKVSSYVVLYEPLTNEQISKLRFLRNPTQKPNKTFRFNSWLGVEQKQKRTYPEGSLLGSTIGYTPNYLVTRQEAEERFVQCMDMINANRARGTDTKEYLLGLYGLEQRFCSELGGLNGFEFDENIKRQDGADIYLTIDRNIQRKAEDILKSAIMNNIGKDGRPPRDGAIVVIEVKTGKVRAMASYPNFDPNNYSEYWDPDSKLYNPYAFRNVVTSVDYDPGSVMKPITVAAALNVYERNIIESGKRRGIPPTFTFQDYDTKGKPYEERNGNILRINNANGQSYQYKGTLGLKECIRDSINTCIADIVDATGARQLNTYFKEVFGFGRPTALRLPGDGNGDVRPFDRDIACPFCWANFGFGQGFTASPIQIARAYIPLANRGRMVEPYFVEKIKYSDGTIDDGSHPDSPIRREADRQVLTEQSANLTLSYMRAVIDEGHEGRGPMSASLPYHTAAGKTGTAEVSRPVPEGFSCPPGKSIQACNRQLGIYDHTFVGVAPYNNPQFIVLVKLSEPNRGVVNNFSGATVGRPFSEMMNFTLEYYGVPRDKK